MSPRTLLIALVLAGGPAVLGSYAYGFLVRPDDVGVLWGGVPDALRTPYTAWMPVAALGFLVFTHHLVFRVDPEQARVGPFGYGLFPGLYAAILIGSALWMPLCFVLVDHPESRATWLAICAVLWTVGLASVALVVALIRLHPTRTGAWVVGAAAAFTLQTFVLDALIWTAVYPSP